MITNLTRAKNAQTILHRNNNNNNNNSTERKANGENGGDKLTENNQDGKRRNSNQRPRWKINDMCLARWNEDGEVKHRLF